MDKYSHVHGLYLSSTHFGAFRAKRTRRWTKFILPRVHSIYSEEQHILQH